MAAPLASLRSRVFAATALGAVLPTALALAFATRRVTQQAEAELSRGLGESVTHVLNLKHLEAKGFVSSGECSNCGRCSPLCPEGSLAFDFRPLIRRLNAQAEGSTGIESVS